MQRRALLTGLAALAAAPASLARAGGVLGVAPILVEFEGGATAAVVYVKNDGDVALSVQVRVMAWRNEGDEERYAPTQDVAFSPGQFTVPPGGRQVVRLALQTPAGPTERSYRLVVDQLPSTGPSTSVRMPVRMLVPVFAPPAGNVAIGPQTLAWTGVVERATHIATLRAANAGLRHVRLAELTWRAEGQDHVIAPGLAGYVLAASEWSCRFHVIGEPSVIDLTATTERGALHASVPLQYR